MEYSKQTSRLNGSLLWVHVLAVIAVIFWGSSFVSTKVLIEHGLYPVEIYIYRAVLVYLLFFAFFHKKIWANNLYDEFMFVICGVCSGSLYFIAENTALEYTTVTNVALLSGLSPLITALLLGAMYRSERPGRGLYIGSIVAVIGVACVVFNGSIILKVNPFGDLLAFFAAVSWAVYSIILKKLNPYYTVTFITRKTFFYGALTAIPFFLLKPQHAPIEALLNPDVISNMLFLVVCCSGIAFLIWGITIDKLGAVKASNYIYFQPIVTMIVSVAFGKDVLTAVGVIGCLLIILGVVLSDKLTEKQLRGR